MEQHFAASVLGQVPDSPTGFEGLAATRTPLGGRCIILLGYLGWVTCLLGGWRGCNLPDVSFFLTGFVDLVPTSAFSPGTC